MTRSHPPTVRTLVARTLRDECEISGVASILVAVSGGPDSMVLLHVLSGLARELGLELAACGVDHGLRPAAAAELDLVAQFCAQLLIPFRRVNVHLEPGGNLQARARTARYAALHSVRSELGFAYLATAHHQLDRAETVLLRLLRGAGPAGLAVLAPRQGNLLRPLIRVTKAAVLAHLTQHAIASSDDPSNRDPRFLRTRVRSELLPLLEQLSPGIVGHLTSLADELGEPPLPPVLDAEGEAIQLNRSQRADLRRALRDRHWGARVLLSGGRYIALDPGDGQPRLFAETADSGTEISVSAGVQPASPPRKQP